MTETKLKYSEENFRLLYEALKEAAKIIREHIPQDGLGIGGGEHDGSTWWYLRDEYLGNFDAILKSARGES